MKAQLIDRSQNNFRFGSSRADKWRLLSRIRSWKRRTIGEWWCWSFPFSSSFFVYFLFHFLNVPFSYVFSLCVVVSSTNWNCLRIQNHDAHKSRCWRPTLICQQSSQSMYMREEPFQTAPPHPPHKKRNINPHPTFLPIHLSLSSRSSESKH